MDTVSLTYQEIAKKFGITRKSAENMRRRKGWATTKGNDKRVRVQVPVDVLPDGPQDGPPEGVQVGAPVPPQSLPDDLIRIAQLEGAVGRWQAEAALEKERRVDLERERDNWRDQAKKSLWRRIFG